MEQTQPTSYGDPKHDRINVAVSMIDLTVGLHLLICVALMMGMGIADVIKHPYITMFAAGVMVSAPCALSIMGSCTATRVFEERKWLGNHPSLMAGVMGTVAILTMFFAFSFEHAIVKLMFLSTTYAVWRTIMLLQK